MFLRCCWAWAWQAGCRWLSSSCLANVPFRQKAWPGQFSALTTAACDRTCAGMDGGVGEGWPNGQPLGPHYPYTAHLGMTDRPAVGEHALTATAMRAAMICMNQHCRTTACTRSAVAWVCSIVSVSPCAMQAARSADSPCSMAQRCRRRRRPQRPSQLAQGCASAAASLRPQRWPARAQVCMPGFKGAGPCVYCTVCILSS